MIFILSHENLREAVVFTLPILSFSILTESFQFKKRLDPTDLIRRIRAVNTPEIFVLRVCDHINEIGSLLSIGRMNMTLK